MNTKTLKVMRLNLVIFAVLHFFYAIATTTHTNPIAMRIFIQYWLSSWIIRKFLVKTKVDEDLIILYTWIVSIAVFGVRILLGILFFSLMGTR